jgi:hypothetical protein
VEKRENGTRQIRVTLTESSKIYPLPRLYFMQRKALVAADTKNQKSKNSIDRPSHSFVMCILHMEVAGKQKSTKK